MLNEVSKILDKRRSELVNVLENSQVEIEKQHQIYGAINEIDVIMQTLEYFKAKELRDGSQELKLVAPKRTDSIFKRVFKNINNVFRNR